MAVILTLLFNGLANSALYFLVAAGLTLIFGLLRVINFAHGGIYLWGAYVAWAVDSAVHQFVVAIIAGTLAGLMLGWLTERLLLTARGNGTNQLLLTMGALIVLSQSTSWIFGRSPQSSTEPQLLSGSWLVGHVAIVRYQVFVIVVGLVIFLLLQLVLRRTRLGVLIRAGVHNPELVEARGFPIQSVFTATFVLGAALAGFAGALSGPYFGSVTGGMGMNMQMTAFIIVVLGGLGSLGGSLVGSILIGVATALVSYYAPSMAVLVDVVLMAVVLLVRPHGLLGEREVA